jgi:hypothetical protein
MLSLPGRRRGGGFRISAIALLNETRQENARANIAHQGCSIREKEITECAENADKGLNRPVRPRFGALKLRCHV